MIGMGQEINKSREWTSFEFSGKVYTVNIYDTMLTRSRESQWIVNNNTIQQPSDGLFVFNLQYIFNVL